MNSPKKIKVADNADPYVLIWFPATAIYVFGDFS